jgi:hypothetical protein
MDAHRLGRHAETGGDLSIAETVGEEAQRHALARRELPARGVGAKRATDMTLARDRVPNDANQLVERRLLGDDGIDAREDRRLGRTKLCSIRERNDPHRRDSRVQRDEDGASVGCRKVRVPDHDVGMEPLRDGEGAVGSRHTANDVEACFDELGRDQLAERGMRIDDEAGR